MRETGISIYFEGETLSLDRQNIELYEESLNGPFIDGPYIEIEGEDILNFTLKEGK